MSKLEHDILSAEGRIYNPDKEWFINGLDLLSKHLQNKKNLQFLDMGCGNGEWADTMSTTYPGSSVHCLDYASPHLERVKEKGYTVTNLDLDHTENTAVFVDAHRGKFDVVTAFEVIEHIFDTDAFLAAIHAVLKPDGLFILSTPNVGYISYRLYTMCRGNLPPSEGHHVRFFDQRRLEQVCWVNGFTPKASAPFGKGSFYLDRARDKKQNPIQAALLKYCFNFCHFMFKKKSSLTSAGLLLCAERAQVAPLGLDPTKRAMNLTQLSATEKAAAKDRLKPLLADHFFQEHPSLIEFLSETEA